MSRSHKRNLPEAIWREGGRTHTIRKTRDGQVSHSGDCWMCHNGTKPKRIMHIKPRRRKEHRDLLQQVAEYKDGQR